MRRWTMSNVMALTPDEPEKANGIVEKPENEMMPVEENIEMVIARAEKQIEVLQKVLAIAVKRTTHYDWVDQQGKPYLTASGAEKLMPLFGVNLTHTSYEKKISQDDKGQYYIYQYRGTFSWKGGSIEAIGACSSRDKFFAWDSKEKTYKALSEVDECNIMKAAYSNMMVNGVTRLLGIRNLTWEQLQSFGIDKSKVARVEYGGAKGGMSQKEKEGETRKQNEIGQMCLKMAYGDKEKAVNYLKTLTAFTTKDGKEVEGVTSVRKLTGVRLQIAYKNIKQEYENWKKANERVNNELKEDNNE